MNKKQVKPNGDLDQLSAGGVSNVTWIGWGIIGLLLVIVGFLVRFWITNVDVRIAKAEDANNQMQRVQQEEKGRLNIIMSDLSRLTGILERVDTTLRLMEGRVVKLEISREAEQERRTIKR